MTDAALNRSPSDAVMSASALLRHGPGHIRRVLQDLEAWMTEREWSSLTEMRGNMGFDRVPDPAAYERANYLKVLRAHALFPPG